MYAIVEIAGQQFKVEEGKKIFVHRLEAKEGDIDFDRVLLIDDEGAVTIGAPIIEGAVVGGKILDQVRGEKVIVFKKKRKKGYRVKNGHRQNFTQVEIVSINGKGQKKKTKKAEAEAATGTEEVHAEKKPRKAAAHKEGDENTGNEEKATKKHAKKE